MKKLSAFITLALLALAPLAAQPQPMTASSMTQGVGAHGYDFLIGTWSCLNSMPVTPMSGPAATSATFSRSGQDPTLYFRVTGKNFEVSGYIAYAAKTKMWSNPVAFSDGSYSSESTTATGKSVTWTGSYVGAGSSKATKIRDTYTLTSATKYVDLSEYQDGSAWKASSKTTCTKS
jgi:hypothetical protein